MSARAEVERRRTELVGTLRGAVLEVGAGRGANFSAMGPGVTWIGLEPDARRCIELAANARRHGHDTPPLQATCEAIPLETDSVNAVLGTIVLCSVDDPDRALAEIARVMRPGGIYVFAEHVAAPRGTMTRRLQQFATPLTRRFDHGCNPARDTAETLRTSPLTVLDLDVFELPVGLGVTVPFMVGRATLADPL